MVLGAVVNLFMNIILIKRLGALGAVIGTLLAELTTCIWQYVKMNKLLNSLTTLFKSLIYLFFGVLMFISVRCLALSVNNNLFGLFFEVVLGAIVYVGLCFIYWKVTKNSIIYNFIRRKNN